MSTEEEPHRIEAWLEANVRTYPTPESVTLSGFDVDIEEYQGSFDVTLDENTIPDRFSFGLAANGMPELFLPIVSSPLGVPASYATVELTDETLAAIKQLLASTLPRMRPFGLNRETGELVLFTTHGPLHRILDEDEYRSRMAHVRRSGFSITTQLRETRQ